MNINSILHQLSLKNENSIMIRTFVEMNHLEINTFIVISKRKMLENDLSPNSPRIAWIQDGELVEKNQINPDEFFFAITDGCGYGKLIVVPDSF